MALRRRLRDPNERVLRPVWPNAGLEADYRRRLCCLLDEMQNSILYWLSAAYKRNEPRIAEMAQDDIPASELHDAVRRLTRQWRKRFNEMAPELAKYFALAVHKRSSAALRAILKKGGIAIEFKMTAAQRDILNATIFENVNLIKSIPAQYLTQVEGMVMRSVQTGRDLQQLTSDLRKQFGVTRRRAELIARDQNNKATSAMTRARQVELGIKKAIWLHSHAGKVPRPTHVKMDGKKYDPAKGMFDKAEGRNVFPGELINCRCVSRSVIAGFS